MEGVTEEARAPGSLTGFSLPPGLSKDQENNNDKSSTFGGKNEDRVVRENEKHKVDEDTCEKLGNEFEHAQTKASSDKEMGDSSLGKVDGNKELRLGVGSELEANKATGDDWHMGNGHESDGNDGIGNTVCSTVGENTDETYSKEIGKIQNSECELSNSVPRNDDDKLRYDMQVDKGLGHNKEQEQNGTIKMKEVDHNGSEHPDHESSHRHGELKENDVFASIANNSDGMMESSGVRESEKVSAVKNDTEKLIKAGEESEEEINRNRTDSGGDICDVDEMEQESICNDDVMERCRSEDSEEWNGNVNVDIKGNTKEDSEGGIGNVNEVMESKVIGDLKDMNAVSKDADELAKDAEKSGAAARNELVERNRIENSDKDSVSYSNNKSAEKAEEIKENQGSAEIPTDDAKEMGAEVTQDLNRNEKDIVEVTLKNEEEMNLKMKGVEVREENVMGIGSSEGKMKNAELAEKNGMDLEYSEREEKDVEKEKDVEVSKEKAKSVKMTGKEERQCAESGEKKDDTEMTGENRDVETTEEIMMDIRRTEGNEGKDEVEGNKGAEMSDAEEMVDEEGKKKVDMTNAEESVDEEGKKRVTMTDAEESVDEEGKKKVDLTNAEESVDEEGKKRVTMTDAEMVDEREEGTDKKLEEDKCGGTEEEGSHEINEKGQEYRKADLNIMEESPDYTISGKEKDKEEKMGELVDKVCTSEETEGTRGTVSMLMMAERSPSLDEREERSVSDKRSHYNSEVISCTRSKHEIYKKQNYGVKDITHTCAVKVSEIQTGETDTEQQEREAEKAMAKLTSGEELQNRTDEGQTANKNSGESDMLNASEDPQTLTGKDQSVADKKLNTRAKKYYVPNLDKALPNQSEQDQPKVQELEKRRPSTERSTLNQELEKSSSMLSNEERGRLHQQGEVQGNISVREANRKSDHLKPGSFLLGNTRCHETAKQSSCGKEVTVMRGHYKKSYPEEMNNRGMTSGYKLEQSRQNIGDAVCGTSKRPSVKNSVAKKSTSKMNSKTLNSFKGQSTDNTKERRQKLKGGKRGVAVAQPHMQKSSPVQPSSVKEAPRSSVAEQRHRSFAVVPEVVHPVIGTEYVYTRHPNGYLTPVALPTLNSQPWNHVKIKADSDDSDIEIIAESIIPPRNVMASPRNVIVSPMNVSAPVITTPMVCEVCQIIWNDDVLEAIFEGNKAVTVNSKITYGAILCFSKYAEAHYFQNREHTLRNVLERAELGKNIGNLNMTEVIKWLRDMMKHGAAKCCDVFDAVYNPENARAVIASMMNPVPSDAPVLLSREKNIQKCVEKTPKRQISNSSGVKYLAERSSATAKLTSQNLSPKVSKSKDIRNPTKSTHTLSKIMESPVKSGDVVKEVKATLKKSNIHVSKTSLKSSSRSPNKNPEYVKTTLKKCSVYLGKRILVPQHQEYLQPVSSSPTTSKRRRSLEEVEKEVPCKKKGKDSGFLLSDKEYDDMECLSKLGNKEEASEQTVSKKSTIVTCPPNTSKKEHCREKKLPHTKNGRVPGLSPSPKKSVDIEGSFKYEAEKTLSKKSTPVVSKHYFNEDKAHVPIEENEMLDSDTPKDKDCSDALSLKSNTTSVSKQLVDEKSTSKLEQKRESDKVRGRKDSAGLQEDFKEKVMVQDHMDGKNLSKRNRTPSKNKEETEETNIMEVEDRIKNMRNAPLPLLVNNHLSEQKKRPYVDPIPQSVKRQKVMYETQSDPQEEMSKALPETKRRLSSTMRRNGRGKIKRWTSTYSRNSESSSHDTHLDEPLISYDSSDESDCRLKRTQLASPVERARSYEETQKSQKAKRTKSQKAAAVAVKKSALSSESSSDSHEHQITFADDQTSHSKSSLDSCSDSTEVSSNTLLQQLRLSVSGINLYCSLTNTKTVTNGDIVSNSSERRQSTPGLEAVLKERANLDGVAKDAFDLLPFESNNFSFSGYNGSKERYLTNQELLVLQNICVINPDNPDVNMFYKILTQILLARKRVLLVPNSFSLLLVAEGIRKEFNRAKRKGNYTVYLSQDWDVAEVYTAVDFWLGNSTPPSVPSVCTVLSLFCLWKNLEKRVPISFPIALEELCRNLVLKDMDKIGSCIKLYSRYCAFLYEEENLALTKFFLNQPFLGTQTELQKENLLCRMPENSKQASTAPEKSPSMEISKQPSTAQENSPSTGNYKEASAAPGKSSSTTPVKSPSTNTYNVVENDVQMLMKKCMEMEQALLQSSSPKDEENFRKCVQALKYKIDAYKKEIHIIQNLTKETKKKKLQLLSKLINPEFTDCTKELSKHVETLYCMLSKRMTKIEVIKEVKNMSVKETNRTCKPPLVLLCADLGEDITESMKELVYELLINQVNIEDIRPVLCSIVQIFGDENLNGVPSNSWIRNFARVAGLKVRTHTNFLHW